MTPREASVWLYPTCTLCCSDDIYLLLLTRWMTINSTHQLNNLRHRTWCLHAFLCSLFWLLILWFPTGSCGMIWTACFRQHPKQVMNKFTLLGVPLKQTVNDDHVYKTLGISLIKSERDLLNWCSADAEMSTCIFEYGVLLISGNWLADGAHVPGSSLHILVSTTGECCTLA